MNAVDTAAFVRAQTVIASPPLVPEIRLHLATQITPLWEATEASLAAANVPPPYWAFAWPGGQALSRHILDHPDSVRGRRVLDFAAGCGIGAIAAAKAGAAAVIASDIDAIATAVIGLNAAAQRRGRRNHDRRPDARRGRALGHDHRRRCLLRAADGRSSDAVAACAGARRRDRC